MASKVISQTTLDQAARYIEPEGSQNFIEVRKILESNPEYTSQFLDYRQQLNAIYLDLVDPKTKITTDTAKLCQKLDRDQESLVKKSPDPRISDYLLSLGHLLGLKDNSDPHYKVVQDARKKRSFFLTAAQYVDPVGEKDFAEIKKAFQKNLFFTGEFIAYHDAMDKFKKELIEKRTKISHERLSLLDKLHGNLVTLASHDAIRLHLVEAHRNFKAMNEKVR